MSVPVLSLKLLITFWLVAISAVDLVYRRISNWLVVPVMFGGLVWQIYRFGRGHASGLLFAVISWMVIFALWKAHIFGGGDAKFLMGLFALFPDEGLLLLVCVGVVLAAMPLILHDIVRGFRTDPAEVEGGARREASGSRWTIQIPWPSQKRLRTTGKPFVWGFALPGVIYVWWLL